MTIRRVILFVTFLHSCIIHSHIWQRKKHRKRSRKCLLFDESRLYQRQWQKTDFDKRTKSEKSDTFTRNQIESRLSHEWELKCLFLRTMNWKLKSFSTERRSRVESISLTKKKKESSRHSRMFLQTMPMKSGESLIALFRDWFEFSVPFAGAPFCEAHFHSLDVKLINESESKEQFSVLFSLQLSLCAFFLRLPSLCAWCLMLDRKEKGRTMDGRKVFGIFLNFHQHNERGEEAHTKTKKENSRRRFSWTVGGGRWKSLILFSARCCFVFGAWS